MIHKIYCTLLCSWLLLSATAQSNNQSEWSRFYKSLDSFHVVVPSANCKTQITNYKTDLEKMDLNDLQKALTQFHAAAVKFENKPATCTPVFNLIKGMDTVVKNMQLSSNTAVNKDLLSGLIYLRNRIKGYLQVQVAWVGPTTPALTISSLAPSILDKSEQDSPQPWLLYVLPASTYELAMSATGYETTGARLENIKRDTSIYLKLTELKKETGTTGAVVPPVIEKKDDVPTDKDKKAINPWALLSLLLGAALLSLLIMKLTRKRRTVEPVLPTIERELPPLKQSNSHSAYFLSEVMMTAGPRKKPNDDRDLGEDVCGFVMDQDHVLMWVLDGASDYFSERNPTTGREYFSSRLLAQNIAGKLKQQFAAIDAHSFQSIVTNIIADVRMDWLNELKKLPADEIRALLENIRTGNFPECAVTILIAKLGILGDLQVYRSGDCKLFLYGSQGTQLKNIPSPLSSKNSTSNDWLFFRMVEKDGSLDILHNTPLFEIVVEKNVGAMVGVSDGIGSETVQSLSFDQRDREALRNKLVEQIQGTGDDKSLCMVEINNN